jgi:biotin carboxyl carrier protein
MKYNVTIQDKSYLVEIEDINARPVIVYVDGIRMEVIPDANPLGVEGSRHEVPKEARDDASTAARQRSAVRSDVNELTAPLPGTVVEVFVKEGDVIEAGQVVVVIEAMKMKNSIRSTRAGKVAQVLVSPMQTVTHRQALMRFE